MTPPRLEVSGLKVDIAGAGVLAGVSLSLAPGATLGLLGANGAGKTTTIRAILGLLPAREGRIALDGEPVDHLPAHRRARLGIGWMPEDRRLTASMTVEENLRLVGWMRGADLDARVAHVRGLMPDLDPLLSRPAASLSGGQQKLVSLARAVVAGTGLILLDEPTEGIAPALVGRIATAIAAFKAEGATILIADSSPERLAPLLDGRVSLVRGRTGRNGFAGEPPEGTGTLDK